MPNTKTIIIIGGPGGFYAAAKARQCNEDARIILIEESLSASFGKISPTQHLLGANGDKEITALEHDHNLSQRYHVELKKTTKASGLDMDSRCLLLEQAGNKERLYFDKLVFVGGVDSKQLDVPGLFGPRVVNFRTQKDIHLIKQALKEGVKKALVVGAGYYGLEAALSLKQAGLAVTIIEAKRRIMSRYSLPFAQAMQKQLMKENIDIRLDTTIVEANERQGIFNVLLSSGDVLDCDLVVVSIGIEPRISLLMDVGAALNYDGLIRVDDHLLTSLPNVYACGSAISVPYAVSGERKWILEPATIMRTAQLAGHNAAVDNESKMERLGSFCGTLITKINDRFFARTGLNESEARTVLGDENVIITTVFDSIDEARHNEPRMCIKLIVDRSKERIVGGEVFGFSGVKRRIDLLTAAVLESWSPKQLANLDMAYLDNALPQLDPLIDAAVRAKTALLEKVQIMSAERLLLWLKSNRQFRLVDVSEVPFSINSTLKPTKHMPLEILRDRMDELCCDDSPIVLLSAKGHRSYLAQQALMQRGLDAYHLDGGLMIFNLVAVEN